MKVGPYMIENASDRISSPVSSFDKRADVAFNKIDLPDASSLPSAKKQMSAERAKVP